LAVLQAERAAIGAKGRQIDTEAAPIRYVAELVGEGRAAVATTITLLATSGTRRAVPALQCGARDRLQRAPVAP
jgi:hypothetical protein